MEWRAVAWGATGEIPASSVTALVGAGGGTSSAAGVTRRGVGVAAQAGAGGRSHYNIRRGSGLSL